MNRCTKCLQLFDSMVSLSQEVILSCGCSFSIDEMIDIYTNHNDNRISRVRELKDTGQLKVLFETLDKGNK
jgi:hypothetical protein